MSRHKENHERFTWSMSSATRCMATLVPFPSRYIRVKHVLLLTNQKRLRTINDHRDLVVDAGHLIVDIEHLILDTSYFIIDGMRGLQNLCSYHPDLFIC